MTREQLEQIENCWRDGQSITGTRLSLKRQYGKDHGVTGDQIHAEFVRLANGHPCPG